MGAHVVDATHIYFFSHVFIIYYALNICLLGVYFKSYKIYRSTYKCSR